MHSIGKINRRRVLRQINNLALRRQHKNGFVKQRCLEAREQFARRTQVIAPRQQLPQTCDLAGIGLFRIFRAAATLFVAPMRSDPELARLMHCLGANLHLQRAVVWSHHAGVQRAVMVGLGLGDVVVKLARNRLKHAVHNAECGVAIFHLGHHHANGANVVQLLNGAALPLQLVVDRMNVLRAPGNFTADARFLQGITQHRFGGVDVGFALNPRLIEIARNAVILRRLQQPQRQILKLPLDLPHPEPIGQRRKNSHDLPRLGLRALAAPGLGRQRRAAQRHQPFGQLDQHHANVVDHRQQHLAQRLSLLRLLRCGHGGIGGFRKPLHARHAMHTDEQLSNVRAECFKHPCIGLRWQHGEMRGNDAVVVELQSLHQLGGRDAT